MKCINYLLFLLFLVIFCSCEKVSIDLVEFEIDYSWGIGLGENRKNPEIKISGVPEHTQYLEIQLVDLDMSIADHGEVEKILYEENGIIPSGSLKNYIGPSPPPEGHRYEFTIKALDENNVVIGIGKKVKKCCKKIDE